MRMRTKLLLCLLVVSFGLTALSLLVIRTSLQRQIRARLNSDLSNSISTFKNSQSQRREMLRREAALLADLPSLKALMTSPDSRTIQDGAAEFWRVSGGDFFCLLKPEGSVQAFYEIGEARAGASAERQPQNALVLSRERSYLVDQGSLYEIAFQPIYFGGHERGTLLGFVAIGYEVNDNVAREVSEVANADVVFLANGVVASTTLPRNLQADVSGLVDRLSKTTAPSEDTYLGGEHYLVASLPLWESGSQTVRLLVLKSYDQASRYLHRLNELIASLGVVVLILGGGLAVYFSGTITRPLETLASGARALGEGNYEARLAGGGTREICELSDTFDAMRRHLKTTQAELLEAERLATIGEMASSISHDLRHHLTAVYANAEFLGCTATNAGEREELLSEIQLAVHGMTELIDSLLLFSRTGRVLQISLESIPFLVEHAVALVRAHPDSHGVSISLDTSQQIETWIDVKKIERAIYNLLLNACQAAKRGGKVPAVRISITDDGESAYVRITDNGAGVAHSIRKTLFDPFVSEGKQSGVGLGLTLAQKIAQEHGGNVSLDDGDGTETTFTLSFTKDAARAAVETLTRPATPAS